MVKKKLPKDYLTFSSLLLLTNSYFSSCISEVHHV